MSPFLIFAISLTIAYAIYYAVMITRDLYGKKEEAKSNEEVFDISNITEEEAAVAVNESDGGFSVADKQYDTSFQDGTSYDEGYGMGTENNGMSGYSPETDSSGREDDVDEDEGNDVNQQKLSIRLRCGFIMNDGTMFLITGNGIEGNITKKRLF